jgi:hypothetical protein
MVAEDGSCCVARCLLEAVHLLSPVLDSEADCQGVVREGIGQVTLDLFVGLVWLSGCTSVDSDSHDSSC